MVCERARLNAATYPAEIALLTTSLSRLIDAEGRRGEGVNGRGHAPRTPNRNNCPIRTSMADSFCELSKLSRPARSCLSQFAE